MLEVGRYDTDIYQNHNYIIKWAESHKEPVCENQTSISIDITEKMLLLNIFNFKFSNRRQIYQRITGAEYHKDTLKVKPNFNIFLH